MNDELRASADLAWRAQEHAYAPYSRFHVGAALALSDGTRVAGCNVENSSFGATVCAERNAVFAAVTAVGKPVIDHLVVVSDSDPPAVPCALCLQVLREFCPPTLPIHLESRSGATRDLTLGDLLPEPFDLPPTA